MALAEATFVYQPSRSAGNGNWLGNRMSPALRVVEALAGVGFIRVGQTSRTGVLVPGHPAHPLLFGGGQSLVAPESRGASPARKGADFLIVDDVVAVTSGAVNGTLGIRGTAMKTAVVLVTVRVAVFRVRTGFPLFSVAVENALGPDLVGDDGGEADAGYERGGSFEEAVVVVILAVG